MSKKSEFRIKLAPQHNIYHLERWIVGTVFTHSHWEFISCYNNKEECEDIMLEILANEKKYNVNQYFYYDKDGKCLEQ